MKFKELELDILRIFQERILGSEAINSDYRGFTPDKLWAYVTNFQDMIEKKGGIDKLSKSTPQVPKVAILASPAIWDAICNNYFHFSALYLPFKMIKGRGSAYVGSLMTIVGGYVFVMSFKFLAEKV